MGTAHSVVVRGHATVGGEFSPTNPFTPGIQVCNESGQLLHGPLAKPLAKGGGLLPRGPAIDIAFEKGFQGWQLFATDSNQAIRRAPIPRLVAPEGPWR